jgi:hypothetical protein
MGDEVICAPNATRSSVSGCLHHSSTSLVKRRSFCVNIFPLYIFLRVGNCLPELRVRRWD